MSLESFFSWSGLSLLTPRPGLLIVRRRPVTDWLFAFFLAGLGVFALYKAHHLNLACARDATGEGQCSLVYTRLFAPELRRQFPLAHLQTAIPETRGGGRSTEYFLKLLIDYREYVFSWPNSNVYREADRLEGFIKNPQPGAVRLRYDNRAFLYPLGGAVMLGALLWGLWRGTWYAEFDKNQGRLFVRKATFLGRSTLRFRRLQDIRQVLIDYREPNFFERLDRRAKERGRLELHLEKNEYLPLCPYYTGDLDKQRAALAAIERFLRE